MKRLFPILFLVLNLACNLVGVPMPTETALPTSLTPAPISLPTLIPPVFPSGVLPPPTAIPSPVLSPPSVSLWRPAPGLTWQYQLNDLPVDGSFDVDVYDLDLFETDASIVAALHAQGRKVIGYISVGSWEDWRPDAARFPPEVIGRDYEGWELSLIHI